MYVTIAKNKRTFLSILAIDFVCKQGIVSKDAATGIIGKHAFHFVSGFWRVKEEISLKDYIINYQDMQGIGMTGSLALPTLIAISSVALGKTPLNSLAVLGEIRIHGV